MSEWRKLQNKLSIISEERRNVLHAINAVKGTVENHQLFVELEMLNAWMKFKENAKLL